MTQVDRRQKIKQFVERWQAAEGNEDREARSFLIEFLSDVIGIEHPPPPTQILDFERRVKGRKIDAFYEDMGILLEAKSRKPGILDEQRDNGKYGFETPYQQAKWYANELPATIKPRWIIVTDFDEFRIHNLNQEYPERDYVSVKLEDLPEQAYLFDFFLDKSQSRLVKEKELSVEAGEIVGKLYDAFSKQYLNLEESPQEQRSLNMLIVRLVFLLYAEDAGLFDSHQAFYKYMENFSANQSRQALIDLFKMLDTPEDKRDPYASEDLLSFPYVNGSLFADESVIIPQFTEELRVELLLNASRGFDWAKISPTIFGAVFESTLNPETRRAGGMHYTSIENIHKVIDPLFLDDLKEQLARIEGEKIQRKRLMELHEFQNKLASLNIFDPACGSGNFLTESYIQLRRLENRVLESIQGEGQTSIGFEGDADPVKVSIKQFYGIEINDFAVSVAKTALWIAESQMLTETQDIVSRYIDYFPLSTNAHIVEGNALRLDWNEILPAVDCNYIIGNPPFVARAGRVSAGSGASAGMTDADKKADKISLLGPRSGNLDYVACWFKKAAQYLKGTKAAAAFVATNSIVQGEQTAPIWSSVLEDGAEIIFAWNTFKWESEVSGAAFVYVVIVAISYNPAIPKRIFSDTGSMVVESINNYLLPGENVYIYDRKDPICSVPKIGIGNKPIDGGRYLFTEDELSTFINQEPNSASLFHPWLGGDEFLKDKKRYVLWLGDLSDSELNDLPMCKERADEVRAYRLASKSKPTQKLAETPTRFHVENIPEGNSIVIPEVSSAKRKYIPMGFVSPDVFCSNTIRMIPDADIYHFGILQSQFHNAWMRVVASRFGPSYRYSGGVVYNNFPWPDPAPEHQEAVRVAAQNVLDARNQYQGVSLTELYEPENEALYPKLVDAHKNLDKAVEGAYGVEFGGDEERIVAHLFNLYAKAMGA